MPALPFRVLALAAAALLSGACVRSKATAPDPRGARLARFAVSLAEGSDAAAVDALGKALRGVDVVLLGEPTHGDGAAFDAKVRLIGLLHRHLGFDVLAFEGGLLDMELAWRRIAAGEDAVAAGRAALFPVWAKSRQVRPLLEACGASARGPRPLRLAGFDMQLSGSLGRERLLLEISRALLASGCGSRAPGAWRAVRPILQDATKRPAALRKRPEAEIVAFERSAEALAACLASSPDAEVRFRGQLLRSSAVLGRFLHDVDFGKPDPKVMNLRDAQMADNLLWLLDGPFRGRRVIVWAATSHASRRRDLVRARDGGPAPSPDMVPMGELLRERLGARAYVVAPLAYEGRFGIAGRMPSDLSPPRPGSLEEALGALPDVAFLDLRAAAREEAWLREPLLARPMGYVPMRAPWPEVFDAALWVRRMTPSREDT